MLCFLLMLVGMMHVKFCFDGNTQIWHQVQLVNVFCGMSKGIYIWEVGQHVFCRV